MSIKLLTRKHDLRRSTLLKLIIPAWALAGCSQPISVVDTPPLDWLINAQRLKEGGCSENLQESCPELVALGCDEINSPRFYLGGLQPAYAITECIHEDVRELDRQEIYKSYACFDFESLKLDEN